MSEASIEKFKSRFAHNGGETVVCENDGAAAEYLAAQKKKGRWKPTAGFIAGRIAPKGRRMGHAGAIVSAFGESAAEKVEILKAAGVTIAPNPSEMGSTVAKVLAGMKKAA